MAASNSPAAVAAAAAAAGTYLTPISAAGLPATAQMGQAINGLTTGVVTSTTGKLKLANTTLTRWIRE